MRQNDRTPQYRLETWAKHSGIKLEITPNTMFMCSKALFDEWAYSQKRLNMEQFYRWQRKRLDIMIDDNGKPTGGTWNYDHHNRQPLPAGIEIPALMRSKSSPHTHHLTSIINREFADHPGFIDDPWLPMTRPGARQWLRDFIDQRFKYFGAYEDAMRPGEPFLFHSCLSALLNIGLLHPSEVINAALQAPDTVPIASREGFIRQIIGWREFMFGLYHFKPHDWLESNYFSHKAQLPGFWWFRGTAPEPPLDDVLRRIERYGYAHHIERLMVLGNYMLLSRYHPKAVYEWFMSMFVDAYEWVMVPNIIGMSQYADGGIDHGGFATKPYISGSNYLQKMGHWWPTNAAAKASSWTELYWHFLRDNHHLLASNHRLAPLYRNAMSRPQ
jgi:deoxyribodipyrimidine photolyase-related protein